MSTELERNAQIIEEFRANEGKVGGYFEGKTLLLLTTTGAKTGRTHTTPVIYLADGEHFVVFGSNGGAPNNPGWYHNVRANPEVVVEVGSGSFPATAAVLEGHERDELFRRQADRDPSFDEYQARMARLMPVVALTRSS
ncbi:MAG: nitroreductase family deazaflavin-dependent oxidoreductase [Actinomycetota bacterium]|nr:nitroreductase family deazaflavin-dependent oxidoreductase [Actinomycetota bacterium]